MTRVLPTVLGAGAAAFGVLGVVAPKRLAAMMAADEETARAIGWRDIGNALVFASGANRPAIAQRMLYDVSDALFLARRKPRAALAALAFAALGAIAIRDA